jgi:hypothetical protein
MRPRLTVRLRQWLILRLLGSDAMVANVCIHGWIDSMHATGGAGLMISNMRDFVPQIDEDDETDDIHREPERPAIH